jgi:hypothetical protein
MILTFTGAFLMRQPISRAESADVSDFKTIHFFFEIGRN